MVVLILDSAPPGLRGELSKWMIEPKAGVFVGTISGAVRDLLWEKACREVGEGGCTIIYSAANEQGYAIRSFGDTARQIEEWEGLFLVRRPNHQQQEQPVDEAEPPDWESMLHPTIWAKSDRYIRRDAKPGDPTWHPLICHMVDVAMVAHRLWQYLLPPAVKEQMRESLGVPTLEQAGRWVAYFAGLHDLGKANPGFALKWPQGGERLLAEGFKPGKAHGSAPHGFVTAHLLGKILHEICDIDRESAAAIGFAVGGHHGIFPDPDDRSELEQHTGGKRWQNAQKQLAQVLAHLVGVEKDPAPTGKVLENSPFLVLLAGLTSVADWIGSDHEYFPFAGDTVRLPQYPRRSWWRALYALIDLGWFQRPSKLEPLPFQELFGFRPNRLQLQLEQVATQLNGPSLVLLEYPMGGGKTEGALYLANFLQARAGQQGLYTALPTMATSNQMFDRIADYLQEWFPGQPINLQLLHGRADLTPRFARLRRRGKGLPEPPVIEDEIDADGRLVAAEWFTHKKQGLLAPFAIGTVDQSLLAVLQTKHYFVRLFGLAGKVVVLDEVHAYDTYMQSLLQHLLTWLAACGSSVILLSATLPARTREELLSAYASGRGHSDLPLPKACEYPRVSWFADGVNNAETIAEVPTRTTHLHRFQADEVDWMTSLQQQLQAGGCAAVLCNTVGRAQQIYERLKEFFPSEELLLFHARFPFDDRMELERTVLDRFGKRGTDRPGRMVCIATQVIEQSLDIDFDLMVTDLAPVDLILQRSGRIWRHKRSNRPEHFQAPALWILMPPLSPEGVPQFDRATTMVYEEHLLLRSYLALQAETALVVPEQVEALIEAVYTDVPPPEELSAALATSWLKTAQRMQQSDAKDRRKAHIREIPGLHDELMYMRQMAFDDESEEVHTAHQAMTRLGGPSVEVVCLYEQEGLVCLTPDCAEPVDLNVRPSPDGVVSLLGRSLRLSFDPGLVKRILALPVPDTWEVTPHLRRHRLLRFAPDGTCMTEALPLLLDSELGLRKHATEKEAEM